MEHRVFETQAHSDAISVAWPQIYYSVQNEFISMSLGVPSS